MKYRFISSSPANRCLAGAFCSLLALQLLLPRTALAQPGFDFGSGRPERLTTSAAAELIKGKVVNLEGELAVIFMTDSITYLKLKPEAAAFLVEDPTVDCPT